ncbi:MAG: MoaD/ThiS family protein [Thermodesulfovibrionales bacterium]|nr:MoaD/ThiS family protein [Thermodesulfovibrionales bacterium]
MKVTIKLFATLRRDRFDTQVFQFEDDTTIYDILDKLNIRTEDAAIVFLNGKHAELEQKLSDGDIVSIFPPIGGG